MKAQNYKNHKKYYPLHHFIFLPLMAAMVITGTAEAVMGSSNQLEWILFAILSGCILFLAVMLRQHYALGNQDRIVRLEFRLRYFEMFGKRAAAIEQRLSFAQIAALRFAPDDEFETLLTRALNENSGADEIKKAIHHWNADHMRL
jgi:hypothetical protein